MIITFILVIIISSGTLIGAIYDIKKGIIPNKLSFSLIIVGLITNIILSIMHWNINYIEFSIIFGIITFIMGYYLWKIGFWGGGDVKLITAIAIFLPFKPTLYNIHIISLNTSIPIIAIYPFPLTIFLNSILLSLPFVIFYLMVSTLKKVDKANVLNSVFNKKNLLKSFYFMKNDILSFKTLKMIIMSFIISFVIIYIKNGINGEIKTLNLLLITFSLFIFSKVLIHLFKYLKNFLLNKSMITVPISSIEEGMIIQNLQIPKEFEKEIRMNLKSLKIDKLIANSKYASGIDQYEVEFLKELLNRELIKDKIDIKVTIPYGPSLFMGLISGIVLGDICSFLIAILKNILINN
ncbi:MAG: A24 family peptidase [Methanobrevibacter sp.]|jgi:preflagellin peptidase FlaK|nr:A24 family peptidase [Candidatus Methanovirga meridionalis]